MTENVREIAFDTETTGLEWDKDDRIIELGAVELINHIPTGKTFQTYINPGRAVSEATTRITGITDADLVGQPQFGDPSVVDAFLAFVGDSNLVAHNASFDRGFLNAELARLGRPGIEEARWVDTLIIARRRFPGAPASLDALCKRFDIGLESRSFHGALLDSHLLASVYLELLGGRARAFDFGDKAALKSREQAPATQRVRARKADLPPAEAEAHAAFIESLGPEAVWKKFA